jgi:hypothetical protein
MSIWKNVRQKRRLKEYKKEEKKNMGMEKGIKERME